MASEFQHSYILKAELDISTKLSNLEERTTNLESEFLQMIESARQLTDAVKRYVDKTETETKSWSIIESMLEGDARARDVLDHVKIFFNFLLAKMASKHAEITDIKMLWHLLDKEGVKEVFRDSLKSFGFSTSDESDIKLLLAVTYKLQVDLERETVAADDTKIGANEGKKVFKETLCEENRREREKCTEQLTTSSMAHDKNCAQEAFVLLGDNSKDTGLYENSFKNKVQSSEFDYTSLSYDVNDKALQDVLAWNVEDSLKSVARRMVAIVLHTLNVGRDKTFMSNTIVTENKDNLNNDQI